LNDLFAGCLFSAMGCHNMRLAIRTRQWCLDPTLFKIIPGPPPSEAADEAELWIKFLCECHARLCPQGRPNVPGAAARERFRAKLQLFFFVFNGRPSGPPVHYTTPVDPEEHRLRRMCLASIMWVVIPASPPAPAINKWTKQYPALLYFVTGSLFGILKAISDGAFANLVVWSDKNMTQGDKHLTDADVLINPEAADDISWNAVACSLNHP